MTKSSEKREFLLKDFDTVFQYRMSYSTMRLGALGASLTILGLVVSFTSNTKYPLVLGIYLIMLMVVFATIQIIGAITRGIYVFGNHISWIEKELGVVGFSTYWGNYLKHNSKDSGSFAFVVATRVINLAISIYVVLGIVDYITIGIISAWQIVSWFVIGLTIFMLFLNEYSIQQGLDPRNFQKRIAAELNKAREEVLTKGE